MLCVKNALRHGDGMPELLPDNVSNKKAISYKDSLGSH